MMSTKSASAWTILLMLCAVPSALQAQYEPGYSEPVQQPAANRWRASQSTGRVERGAYPSRPPGSATRTSWKASQMPESDQLETGDHLRRSRIAEGYGTAGHGAPAHGEVQRVWSDKGNARVKTVYDAQGNVVYRKAWDKRTGEEVPVSSSAQAMTRYQDELGGIEEGYGAPPAQARSSSTGKRAPSRSAKGKKDFIDQDRDAIRAAEAEERAAMAGAGQAPRTPKHHLHHRDVVVRDGPTMWSLAMPVWYNELSGTLSGPAGTGTGTIVNDYNLKPGVELAIPHWFIGFLPIRHNTQVNGAFTFRGTALAGGAQLKFDSDIYEGYHRSGLFTWNWLHMDWMFGAKVFDINVRATDGVSTATYSDIVPIPYLGLIGHWEIDANLMIKGFAKYSNVSVGNVSEEFIEGEIGLAYDWGTDYEFSKRNQVMLGYRRGTLDATVDNNSANRARADVDLAGPIAKLTAYF